MSRGEAEVCAQCHKFAMKEYPEQARAGKGRCTGYDGSFAELRDPFVAWDNRACVLYTRSPNQAARVQWFEAQEAKPQQEQKG
jgi:hypothetical protein